MSTVHHMLETVESASFSASSESGFSGVEADGSPSTTTIIGASSTQSINGLLSGYKWAVTNLTYSFPNTTAPYGGYGHTLTSGALVDETLSFSPVTALAQTSVREGMKQVSAFTGLTITENVGDVTANIRVAESSLLPAAGGTSFASAYAYYPTGFIKGGDVWLGPSTAYDSPFVGSVGWRTIWHELGHALGLKHAHEVGGVASVAVPAARNSHEYTVMTYYSYVGGPTGYPNEVGGHPQSFMMDDIRALQQMYGADFTSVEAKTGNTIYRFSSTTGQMTIQETLNGATTTTNELAPGVNRILRTIWDGGGIDTYNFSNYTTNMTINLQPGEWSTLSAVQLANLGNNNYARGNLANALQYNDDTRSLIENAISGSGNDTLVGNAAINELRGGLGNDIYFAVEANDALIENANEGVDTVNTSASIYSLGNHLENLTGTGSAQTLIGNGVANVINGTAGNDLLIGGAGNDILTGGSGDDIIHYDAADTAAGVVGGIGTDTLLVRNIAAPISFSLLAQSFERAEVLTDDSGNNAWLLITDVYNASWALQTRTVNNDNNSRDFLRYDQTGSSAEWSLITENYNALNQLASSSVILDNQSYNKSTYDLSGAAWSLLFDNYNSQNQKTAATIIFDDQSYNKSTYDLSGAAWSLLFDDYNSQNQKTASTVIFDDQSYNKSTYDLIGASWSLLFDNYTGANQRAFSTVVMDDQSYNKTTYDLYGGNWSQFTDFYNTAGQRTRQVGTFDNGQTWEYLY
jgi:serralysin